MPEPFPHQVEGAKFLADRCSAILADEPRVGKTGAAIMAADDVLARRILVITTASGRPVWARGFREWSSFNRSLEVLYTGVPSQAFRDADVQIIGWSGLGKLDDFGPWNLIICDESHYAKNVDAKRTKHLYGAMSGNVRNLGLVDRAKRVWCLTGTPIANAPNDLYPALRALAPERLEGTSEAPAVATYDSFLHRYCIVRKKRVGRFNQIDVVIGGRNLDELKARLDGFILRRTQQDVGITRPHYDILPIHLKPAQRREIEASIEDADEILTAAEVGETKSLDMHLGTLRRVTGHIKTAGVIEAVRDEFEGGLDKVVLMAWHKDTMAALASGLTAYDVVQVHGGTTPKHRDEAVEKFQNGDARIFVGQIVACGEAIDLSAAADLIFAESSFVPKDMAQAALRITNHGQTRQPRVRVAALEGSIDEALQAILVRKMAAIRGVTA